MGELCTKVVPIGPPTTTQNLEFNSGSDQWTLVTKDISCKVTKSANQSLTNNTNVIITWNQEDYDTDSMHDNVTNNSRITIKTAGKYSVTAQGVFASNDTGRRDLDILKNGSAIGKIKYLAVSGSQHIINFIDEFAVNDYVELRVKQDSGGSLDFSSSITYFEGHKI